MATKINVRSPYHFYNLASSGGAPVGSDYTLNLKIWTGSNTVPGTVTRSLTKKRRYAQNTTAFTYVTFEIAELIRDYIKISFNGEYDSYCVWVNDGTNTYLAVDGYGYYEEGTKPELSRTKLISNDVIWRPQNENIRVPFYADDTYEVVMSSKGRALRSVSITAQTNTANMIQYVSVSGELDVDDYEQRVLDNGGIYEENPILRHLHSAIDVNLVDEIKVYSVNGSGMIDAPLEIIKVRTMHSNRYPDTKITFVNKLGAFQDVYFFAKEAEGITTNSDSYKASSLSFEGNSYFTHQHQYIDYNKQGREYVQLSTGFVSEDYNEVLKQMMLSEQVWMTKNNTVFPVNPRTNSLTYMTSLNDKMVAYTIDFDYAFDKIQNVR